MKLFCFILILHATLFYHSAYANDSDNALLIKRNQKEDKIEIEWNSKKYSWEIDFRQLSTLDARGSFENGPGGQGFNPGDKREATKPVLAKPILLDGRKPYNPDGTEQGRTPMQNNGNKTDLGDFLKLTRDSNGGRILITLDANHSWEINDDILTQIFPELSQKFDGTDEESADDYEYTIADNIPITNIKEEVVTAKPIIIDGKPVNKPDSLSGGSTSFTYFKIHQIIPIILSICLCLKF